MQKVALVTGATGQDGSYLIEHLTKRGYFVYGLHRRISRDSMGSLDHHTFDPDWSNFATIYGDITDPVSIEKVFEEIFEEEGKYPDHVYHMAAFSHVGQSYTHPHLVMQVNTMGTLNMLESFKRHCDKEAVFYHAATSELFSGDPETSPQDESTPFEPRSPYAVSKLAAYHLCEFYKGKYDLNIVQGILFNHESPRRGHDFVTMKIIRGLIEIAIGERNTLGLGNLDAQRDWGDAETYMLAIVEVMEKAYREGKAANYVIGTGNTWSVEHFLIKVKHIINYIFHEELIRLDEHVYTDPRFVRKQEVWKLCADPTAFWKAVGWSDDQSFDKMVYKMIKSELETKLDLNDPSNFEIVEALHELHYELFEWKNKCI